METLNVLHNNIGIIVGILTGIGFIAALLIKGYKFVKKVNDKIDFIDDLQKRDIIKQITEIPSVQERQTAIENAVQSLTNIVGGLTNQVDTLIHKIDDMNMTLKSHTEQMFNMNQLILDQSRFTLETTMKKSIDKGYASVDEKKLIGSLFASYDKNNGNYGIRDVFDVYKELPVNPINKE